MIEELAQSFKLVQGSDHCRVLVLSSSAKHFSAGADLKWMKKSADLSFEENVKDAQRMREMFEALASLRVPSVCVVNGSSYGGALGLISCCDIAIADDQAKFCLSEVRLGLLPAVIFPYLARKIPTGILTRMALTGAMMNAQQALQAGLLGLVCTIDEIETVTNKELERLLSGGPEAQRTIKSLLTELRKTNYAQSDLTVDQISRARVGSEGQSGIAAFLQKNEPPFKIKSPLNLWKK